jgi:hypothetical protein
MIRRHPSRELRKSSASITGWHKKAYERCLKTVDAARMFLDISEAEELPAFMKNYVQRQIRLYGPTVIMETVEDVFQLIRLLEESGAGGAARRTINYGSQQRRGPRGTGRRPLTCYGCGEEGHRVAVCPQRTVRPVHGQVNAVRGGEALRCWNCGHRRADCTSCSWGIWKSYQCTMDEIKPVMLKSSGDTMDISEFIISCSFSYRSSFWFYKDSRE